MTPTMPSIDDLRQKAIDLTAIAARHFKVFKAKWMPVSTRDFFHEAVAPAQRLEKQARKEYLDAANKISLERLEGFAESVNDAGVPCAGAAMEELQQASAKGIGKQGIWDLVVSKQIGETFYLPDFPLPEDSDGTDLAWAVGKAMVRYLGSGQPAFREKLQELFQLCEKHNMAIEFRFPEICDGKKVKGPEYVLRLPELTGGAVGFTKMEIVVSPFDTHYKPLTVGRQESIPEARETGEQQRNRFRDYIFSHHLVTGLHPDGGLRRLVTGRSYSP